MIRSLLLASAATLAAPSLAATPQPLANSAAISGLGIRNIGSATMSGRVAAVDARQEADAKAYGIDAMMKAFAASDAKVLQALASVGMQPGQLLALAFRDLAGNAAKIGQLNVSPDLLREIMDAKGATSP